LYALLPVFPFSKTPCITGDIMLQYFFMFSYQWHTLGMPPVGERLTKTVE
jgi:hypothetical protein